jgi:hypothetical protein
MVWHASAEMMTYWLLSNFRYQSFFGGRNYYRLLLKKVTSTRFHFTIILLEKMRTRVGLNPDLSIGRCNTGSCHSAAGSSKIKFGLRHPIRPNSARSSKIKFRTSSCNKDQRALLHDEVRIWFLMIRLRDSDRNVPYKVLLKSTVIWRNQSCQAASHAAQARAWTYSHVKIYAWKAGHQQHLSRSHRTHTRARVPCT